MITEKQLFNQGWGRFGDNEGDPFYRVYLKSYVFNLRDLAGNFTEDGRFVIYGMNNREFESIDEVVDLFTCCRFEIDYDLMSRYRHHTFDTL